MDKFLSHSATQKMICKDVTDRGTNNTGTPFPQHLGVTADGHHDYYG
jgi:hypothetical protein